MIVCATLALERAEPAFTSDAIQDTFYAAPGGSGNVCTRTNPCSLPGAVEKVRSVNSSMTGDIVVYLRGGTYALDAPIKLTGKDSGTDGYRVIYSAYGNEKPVLSGGQEVTGWSLYDPSKNIYRAKVDPSLNTRQLFVNNVRAVRARSEMNPQGFTANKDGYYTEDTSLQGWHNEVNLDNPVEFVDLEQWQNYRCPVDYMNGNQIVMANPCWANSQRSAQWANYMPRMNGPAWIENAYELLDKPGEWYLNRSEGYVYYIPRSGENLASADVVAPRLENLLEGAGTPDDPLENVTFRGLSFINTTWLRPSTSEGYAPLQSGFLQNGDAPVNSLKTPASVSFTNAKSVVLERNFFWHLGNNALNLNPGTQDNLVVGNKFQDISSGAIYLGDIEEEVNHHPSDPRQVVEDNTISDNYITQIGQDYSNVSAILATYTDGTVIDHNEISNVPYTGISLGWGWGQQDPGGSWGYNTPTTAQNNTVTNNEIHDYTQILQDGGGVYTMSSIPGSKVAGNYIYNQIRDRAALYPDEGTKNITFSDNVASRVLSWLNLWSQTAENNTVADNFSSTAKAQTAGQNTFTNNTVVKDDRWPPQAVAVIKTAGLQAEYRDIKSPGAPAASSPSNTQPMVSVLCPQGTTTSGTPTIKAVVADQETNLRKSDIAVYVDGRRMRRFSYNATTDILSVRPPGALSLGGHEVAILARDPQGARTKSVSQFYVISPPTQSGITVDNLDSTVRDYATGSKEVTVNATVSANTFTAVDQLVVGIKNKETGQYGSFLPAFEYKLSPAGSSVSFKKVITKPGTYEYWIGYYANDAGHVEQPVKTFTVS